MLDHLAHIPLRLRARLGYRPLHEAVQLGVRELGREDLATGEAFEAEAIEAYLPAELSDDELDALVANAIAETGAASPKDMGKAIKHVMAAAGGRADGRRVSTKVKEALN